MDSRQTFGAPPRRVGPLRFPSPSVGTRHPQPPRRAQRLLVSATSPPVLGFIQSERLATLNERNEAESASLALRLAPSSSGCFMPRITPGTRPVGYVPSGSLHGELLSSHETNRYPDAPDNVDSRKIIGVCLRASAVSFTPAPSPRSQAPSSPHSWRLGGSLPLLRGEISGLAPPRTNGSPAPIPVSWGSRFDRRPSERPTCYPPKGTRMTQTRQHQPALSHTTSPIRPATRPCPAPRPPSHFSHLTSHLASRGLAKSAGAKRSQTTEKRSQPTIHKGLARCNRHQSRRRPTRHARHSRPRASHSCRKGRIL